MTNRLVFSRAISIFTLGALIAACSGGGGGGVTAQPPPASHAQIQALNAQPVDAGSQPDAAPDNGTLLPLQDLTVRNTGATTMSVTGCASTSACIGGTNTSTGPGVSGVSSLGKGVTGTTTFNSTSGSNGQYGVYGQDSSASGNFDVGVYGISVRGVGTSGKSTSSYGVRGTSSSNIGVYGNSANYIGVYGAGMQRGVTGTGGPIGVYGTGTSEGLYGTSTSSIGVYGTSTNGYGAYATGVIGVVGSGSNVGVEGVSSGGTAGYFSTSSGRAVYASSSSGRAVYAQSSTGFAIEGHTGGSVGVYATNSNGNGGDFTGSYAGVIARAPTSGFPLIVTDSSGNNLFYVTGAGDVYYHGGLHTFATLSRGAQALAYSAQTTRPSIEDTGTARLVDGHAVVMLDSTFARAIDTQRPYQVFLTPGGDTRGLYVASKSASAFVVREVQGGRGSFSFDYHIYATAMGKTAERMTVVGPNARPLRAPAVESPKLPQLQRPQN